MNCAISHAITPCATGPQLPQPSAALPAARNANASASACADACAVDAGFTSHGRAFSSSNINSNAPDAFTDFSNIPSRP